MVATAPSESVLVDHIERAAIVTLNRPASMNAFTTAMAESFINAMTSLSADPSVRVIVITGSGERAFCAGADLKERNTLTSEQWRLQHKIFEKKNELIRNCPKPVIGAINGVAVGGGMELALEMDFLLASSVAKFGLPEVKRGIIPGGGGTQWLPRKVPFGMAMQMLLSGESIDANEALRIGLVNAVVAPEELLETVLGITKFIVANSPTAIEQVRKSVRLGSASPIDTALGIELQCYARMINHPDRQEGVGAFVEKRTPKFLDLDH